MRIQVIGNCQARPISSTIGSLLPEAEMLDPIVLHLSKEEMRGAHEAQLSSADLIFAQLTVDTFKPGHLATSGLKQRFDDKVVVWPNIFYAGQQPYLRYFTHTSLGRLFGPIEALHDLRLHRSWLETGRVQKAAMFEQDSNFESKVRGVSLESLKAREATCDVYISDLIEAREAEDWLFFTFNHPTQLLLGELARRMLRFCDVSFDPTTPLPSNEPLNRYQVPSSWSPMDMDFQGDNFEVLETGLSKVLPGRPVVYTGDEICQALQSVYDAHPIYRTMDGVRLTPDF